MIEFSIHPFQNFGYEPSGSTSDSINGSFNAYKYSNTDGCPE
jgi:hypothetical protein